MNQRLCSKCGKRPAELYRLNCNVCDPAPQPVAEKPTPVTLSSSDATSIRTHLSNQRASLRAKLPRAWNKIQAQRIEREIKEIDQLLGVLRSV